MMVLFLEKYFDKIDVMIVDFLCKYEEIKEVFNYDKLDILNFKIIDLDGVYLFDKLEIFDC